MGSAEGGYSKGIQEGKGYKKGIHSLTEMADHDGLQRLFGGNVNSIKDKVFSTAATPQCGLLGNQPTADVTVFA